MTASKIWALVAGLALVATVAIAAATGRFGDRWRPTAALRMDSPLGRLAESPPAQRPATAQPVAADAQRPAASVPVVPPSFDVVRIEPSGDALVAGKSDPDSRVALLDGGKAIAETKADAGGNFVILPPPLRPGSYTLSLQQRLPGKPNVASTQSVAVSVPTKSGGALVVALAEPGKPTRVLAGPPAVPAEQAVSHNAGVAVPPVAAPAAVPAMPPPATEQATKSPAGGALAFRSVALAGSGFQATGAAAPGAHLEIYLNGSHFAGVVAGPDGRWSVLVRKGLTGGHYAVRADALGSGGAVVSRAEVPFDVPSAPVILPDAPAQVAADTTARPQNSAGGTDNPGAKSATTPAAGPAPGATPPSPAGSLAASGAADAAVDQIATALVVHGDNLWRISRSRFGQGSAYTRIYAANATQIRDPRLIYPGQVFVVPDR